MMNKEDIENEISDAGVCAESILKWMELHPEISRGTQFMMCEGIRSIKNLLEIIKILQNGESNA